MTEIASTGLQLRSLVEGDGTLRRSLETVDVPAPRHGEVVVRVDAAPINPSDLGLLLGGADMASATFTGSASTVTAPISPDVLRTLAGRIGGSLPVGNEGAGTVVAAGASAPAQALHGGRAGS